MKKYKYILIVFLYLIVTFNLTISLHYCGNKITQVSILSSKEVSCACDAIGKTNCCHDAQVQVKFELPSTLLAKVIVDKIAFIDLFFVQTSTPYYFYSDVQNNLVEYVNDHPPQQIQLIETTVLRI